MNRVELMEKLEPVMRTQTRTIEHNPRTRFVITPEQVVIRPGGGGRSMEVTRQGTERLFKFAGLTNTLAEDLLPATVSQVTTELMARKERYTVVVKDGQVVDVTAPTTFHNTNPERVLTTIEAAIPGVEYNRVLFPNPSAVNLEVVGERRQPVGRGDLIQAGMSLVFSPIGNIKPIVQSYVLRLACTNGATHNDVLREFSWGQGGSGNGDGFWNWLRQSAKDAYGAMDGIVRRYQELVSQAIPEGERAALLEAMIRQAGISGEAAQAIRAMALETPPQNHYDMMNLLTYATSHLLADPRQVMRARQSVAEFVQADAHDRICPVCRQARHGRNN